MKTNKIKNSLRRRLSSTLVLTVGMLFIASAATAAPVQYTHDEHYIYIRTPIPLTMSPKQRLLIKQSVHHVLENLATINKNNPRLHWAGPLTTDVASSARKFDQHLDAITNFAQKYYGKVAPVGYSLYKAWPSGALFFLGTEYESPTPLLKAGGSIMLGVVLVPMHVSVVDIDTNKVVREYYTADWSIIGWPTTNVGFGATGGVNARAGVGVIWGELARASDFHGFVGGVATTVRWFGTGVNLKFLGLLNLSKGNFSNTFVTAAYEGGTSKLDSLHLNASMILNATTLTRFIGGVSNRMQGLFQSHPASRSHGIKLAAKPDQAN